MNYSFLVVGSKQNALLWMILLRPNLPSVIFKADGLSLSTATLFETVA